MLTHCFQIETALMHDTVRVFSAALREFTIFGELAPEKTECFGEATRWEQGAEILKIIDEVRLFFVLNQFSQITTHFYRNRLMVLPVA